MTVSKENLKDPIVQRVQSLPLYMKAYPFKNLKASSLS